MEKQNKLIPILELVFKKRKWNKWQHVMFVEDFGSGIKTYELLRRVCEKSGLVQWKRVYVKQCVHHLSKNLTENAVKLING